MKKLLGYLILAMMLINACEGPMGPAGRDGRDGRDGKDGESTQWFIQDFEIFSKDWKPVHDPLMGNIFEFGFNFPELTSFIVTKGAVVCYLIQKVDNVDVHTPLPYTFFGEFEGFLYSENYTFEASTKYINFIVKVSDFDTDFQQPMKSKFRVVLMW